jgi:NAD(P)-dependent dehydrogenase (short-subunit alcohol dehydrogenase family)
MRLPNDYTDKAVLVTGGTKGLGLAIGLAFGAEGAHVYLTHKWGSADEDQIRQRFAQLGAREPVILEADAALLEDAIALLETVKRDHERIETFISNVSFAQVIKGMEQYNKRAFFKSLDYSAWPFVGYLLQIRQILGCYPRYVIATSCDGPNTYYPGYDFVAVSKAMIETFCRYISTHLFEEDVRVNVLRSRPVATDSLVATFGQGFEPFLKKYYSDDYFIDASEVADAVLALCSGMMDQVSGQVILLDRGVGFCDNLMRLYEDRENYGL